MTWIDAVIILIIVLYALDGYRRGFIKQTYDLVSLVASFILALRFYNDFGLLLNSWGLGISFAKPVAFFALWGFSQVIFYFLSILIFYFLPRNLDFNKVNQCAGIIPGLAKGVITISILLVTFIILPFSTTFRDKLMDSSISSLLIKSTSSLANQLEKAIGGIDTSLTYLGTHPQNTERIQLNFQTNQFVLDAGSEEAMVEAVNAERAKAGLKPLKVDDKIRKVARDYSVEMAKNGYFSHEGLSGQSPFDRLRSGGIIFRAAGENIALAPTYELAQIGLMNSPEHRANILDPNFRYIGIGIIDIGAYGRMITQDFTD